MIVANFYIKDNDKPCNIELIQFLDEQKQAMWNADIRFTFEFVETDAPYIKRGITKLPAMIVGEKKYLGMDRIRECVAFLRSGKITKRDDDDFHDVAMKQLSEKDDEDDKDDADKLKKRCEEESQRRAESQKSAQKSAKKDAKKPATPRKSPTNKDDDLMASKFGLEEL